MKNPNNCFSYQEYKQEMEKPLSEKIKDTERIIEERLWEFGNKCYIAWSGGKDSTLVLWFARQLIPDIPVMFNNTGVEHPETVKFVRDMTEKWDLNLIETRPIKGFWQCVKEYGYPDIRAYHGSKWRRERAKRRGKQSGDTPKCCIYTKEFPAREVVREQGFKAYMTGITAAESMQRRLTIIRYGYCYKTTKHMPWPMQKVHPVWMWSPEEVWQFHKDKSIPYNPAYDKGIERCGCMPCTGYKTWRETLIKINPGLARKITNDMGEPMLGEFI